MAYVFIEIVAFTFVSAVIAGFVIFYQFRNGDGLSCEDPRSLASQFLGLLIACELICFSFIGETRSIQWELRGLAVLSAAVGFVFSLYFEMTPEAPIHTAFEQESTTLKSK